MHVVFRRTATLALAAALVSAGCGWLAKSVEILEVRGTSDGTTLEMDVASCGAKVSADVREDLLSVTIYAHARQGTGAECTDTVAVELEEPLGGRRIIDGFDFTVLEPVAPEP